MFISTSGIGVKGNRFLLALRKPGSSIGESWEFPGGKMENGETPEEALLREFREELGVDIDVIEQLCDGDFENNGKRYKIYAFRISLISEDFVLTEHIRTGWFTLKEMENLPMAGSDKQISNCLRSQFPLV